MVRLDPGQGRGHHEKVKTAGRESKFGVSFEEFDRLRELAKKAGTKIIGFHAHVGSGIFRVQTWAETAEFLAEIAKKFKDVRILNLGGGLGIPEKPGQSKLTNRKRCTCRFRI